MIPLGDLLNDHFNIHYLDLSGHGGKSDQVIDFTMDLFVNDLKKLLDDARDAHVFGYSMGGFVALLTAAGGDTRINSITTLGTKLKWNEEIAMREAAMLDPDKIEEKIPKFAEMLAIRHGKNHWKSVLSKTCSLLKTLGENQPIKENSMKNAECSVLLLLADQDEMVSQEETEEVKGWLPQAEFSILTNSKHPIEKVDLNQLAVKIKTFVKSQR